MNRDTEVDHQIETITPAIAIEYQKKNTHNRPLKHVRIKAYANEMRAGRWRLNGEGIKFGKSGLLLDGQNRLEAIILADTPIKMSVFRNVDDLAQESMDGQVPRSLGDLLKLRGEVSVSVLASVIRSLYLWDATADPEKRVIGGTGQGYSASNAVLLGYFDENSDTCRHISHRVDVIRRPTGISGTVLAPLIREMERIEYDDADDFLYRLATRQPSPLNQGENDPLVQLHNTLHRIFKKGKFQASTNPTEVAALIVKAWNAYRQGVPLRVLRWRSGGNAPEGFPVMK